MNTEFFKEPINQFHWRILKTVGLILAILPVQQAYLELWQISQASSQIVFGFFALSLFCSWLSVGFICALQLLQFPVSTIFSDAEMRVVKYYKQLPMLLFVLLVAYISSHSWGLWVQ
ncbi:hypothetical protein [Acinetobacter sp. MD2(2019)]|uniref:hypothetical protein n=1 Tax=Acinetobacter sp. MD2(2019) TaxID=2605273 RepID=UPI002D1F3D98|nr:hypothetical protein [Acinetobacter sp. MD2(2019)]MEB3753543.1 hypothetical protein [Acinetobacter sp. MD2(2019)]